MAGRHDAVDHSGSSMSCRRSRQCARLVGPAL
jgi:hypothetical protein